MTKLNPNTKKVFLGYGIICALGAVGFGLARVFITKQNPEILAARERIHNAIINRKEDEKTPLAYTKQYKEEVKQLENKREQKSST